MDDLVSKTAFVSGGASGLGLAMARQFLNEGMNVVIGDIEDGARHRVEAEHRDLETRLLTVPLDVTDRASYAAAAERAVDRFGHIHVVCNNAGVIGGGLRDADFTEWDWVIGVNVMGVVNGVLTFLPLLKAHEEGAHIVNTASIAGVLSGGSPYDVSKAATLSYSEGLRWSLAQDNIGVSVLCPGLVDTNLFHAERNRPHHLQRGDDVPVPEFSEEERAGFVQQRRNTMITPEYAAARVIDAIRNNDLYIFTHPDLKRPVEARFSRIMDAMDGLPEPPLLE